MAFSLGDLIAKLQKHDPEKVLKIGFNRPHSYRGDYSCLAFEKVENITVGEMLNAAQSAIGKTFTGYKGGDYIMNNLTDIYLAEYGSTGEQIGELLMSYMLGEV